MDEFVSVNNEELVKAFSEYCQSGKDIKIQTETTLNCEPVVQKSFVLETRSFSKSVYVKFADDSRISEPKIFLQSIEQALGKDSDKFRIPMDVERIKPEMFNIKLNPAVVLKAQLEPESHFTIFLIEVVFGLIENKYELELDRNYLWR